MDLFSKPSLTYRINVNLHLPLPTLPVWEQGIPWQLLDVSFFSKTSQLLGQNQQIVNSVVYHLCSSRLALGLTLTFIRHLTLTNSNLIKYKKLVSSFKQSLNNSILLVHIANCSVCIYIMCTFFIVMILNISVCSYCCKLFIINFFYLLPQVMHSVFGVVPCALCLCYMYRVLSHIIFALTK